MALGSASMIYFSLSSPLSGSSLGLEHASDFGAFSSTTVTVWPDIRLCCEWGYMKFTPLTRVLLWIFGVF